MFMKKKLTGRKPGHIYVGGRWLKIGSSTQLETTIPGYDVAYLERLFKEIRRSQPFSLPKEVECDHVYCQARSRASF